MERLSDGKRQGWLDDGGIEECKDAGMAGGIDGGRKEGMDG